MEMTNVETISFPNLEIIGNGLFENNDDESYDYYDYGPNGYEIHDRNCFFMFRNYALRSIDFPKLKSIGLDSRLDNSLQYKFQILIHNSLHIIFMFCCFW